MVCTVDHLASSAGVAMLRSGGSAADAAIAANAVLTVTSQHMCGLGGDLWALVHTGADAPEALAGVGRAGSGADPSGLRAEGHDRMPFRNDVRSSTVPGCVDGWIALHERHGRLDLADLLAPAISYAEHGFPASPLLALAVHLVAGVDGAGDYLPAEPYRPGRTIRRPLVAEVLRDVAADGRDGFYGGRFGHGLVELGRGLYDRSDLDRSQADWVAPVSTTAWDHQIWTVPAPSQGYLTLAAAWIAQHLDLPDPSDGGWVHLLVEAMRWAGHDRNEVLFDGADVGPLVAPDRLAPRRDAIVADRATAPAAWSADGDTMYLCAADADGMAVSLIQSNAADWGAHLVVPGTGVFLHNRGIGFRLDAGHPGELAPGARPLHTLAPALVTTPDGALRGVLGTMGGDLQPQVLLQLLARMLAAGSDVAGAVGAPRWALGDGGFSSWEGEALRTVRLESDAPERWVADLERRGHRVERVEHGNFGHAHAIVVGEGGSLAGAADPRAEVGAAQGY
jgi:gamma-glutamyltranspeptidase / glutathione hydrolase